MSLKYILIQLKGILFLIFQSRLVSVKKIDNRHTRKFVKLSSDHILTSILLWSLLQHTELQERDIICSKEIRGIFHSHFLPDQFSRLNKFPNALKQKEGTHASQISAKYRARVIARDQRHMVLIAYYVISLILVISYTLLCCLY